MRSLRVNAPSLALFDTPNEDQSRRDAEDDEDDDESTESPPPGGVSKEVLGDLWPGEHCRNGRCVEDAIHQQAVAESC